MFTFVGVTFWHALQIIIGDILRIVVFKINKTEKIDRLFTNFVLGSIFTTLLGIILGTLGLGNPVLIRFLYSVIALSWIVVSIQFIGGVTISEKSLFVSLIIFLGSVLYFYLPGAVFHETDSFFWISQGKEFLKTHQLPETTLVSPFLPQFFSVWIGQALSFIPSAAISQDIIKAFAVFVPVLLFWMIHVLFQKVSVVDSVVYQKAISVFVWLICITNPWFLGFILGGDLAPKFLGLLIFICTLVNFSENPRWSLHYFLFLGLFLIHFPELWFMSALLAIGILVSNDIRRILNHSPLVYIPIFTAGYHVSMMVIMLILNKNAPFGMLYDQVIYSVSDWVNHIGVLPLAIATVGGMHYFFRRKKNITLITIIVLFVIALFVVRFPYQFSSIVEAKWQTYRNLLYLYLPISVFAGLFFSYLHGRLRWILGVAIGMQLLLFGTHAVSIYFNRIGIVPESIAQFSGTLRYKNDISKVSQSVHRQNIEGYDHLHTMLPNNAKILIDIDLDYSKYYGVSMLLPRDIYVYSFPKNPHVYERWSKNLHLVSPDNITFNKIEYIVTDAYKAAEYDYPKSLVTGWEWEFLGERSEVVVFRL